MDYIKFESYGDLRDWKQKATFRLRKVLDQIINHLRNLI